MTKELRILLARVHPALNMDGFVDDELEAILLSTKIVCLVEELDRSFVSGETRGNILKEIREVTTNFINLAKDAA